MLVEIVMFWLVCTHVHLLSNVRNSHCMCENPLSAKKTLNLFCIIDVEPIAKQDFFSRGWVGVLGWGGGLGADCVGWVDSL